MQPSEALSATAQIAVTLAGFAGVVVAFRNRAAHEWSAFDKFRLRVLLMNSTTPFILALIGLVLLGTNLAAATIWRLCSTLAFVLSVAMAANFRSNFRRFSRSEIKTAGGRMVVLFVGGTLGIIVTFLQLYNAISLCAFWPFFAVIVLGLSLALLQFVLLVLAGQETTT